MNKTSWLFFKESLTQPLKSGTVIACRPRLADAFLAETKIDNKKLIIELGAGTGAITGKIIEKLPARSKLLVFEINKKMARHISDKFANKQVTVINDSAENILSYLKKFTLPKADLIISTLPLTSIKAPKRHIILKGIKDSLANGGEFLQFQYLPVRSGSIKQYFPDTKISFTSKNFPPGFVFRCIL